MVSKRTVRKTTSENQTPSRNILRSHRAVTGWQADRCYLERITLSSVPGRPYLPEPDFGKVPALPCWRLGNRKERELVMGQTVPTAFCRVHLHERGKLPQNGKECSPPRSGVSGGAVIVVRGRESLLHGEGPQLFDVPMLITQ
jgi:hypothetical protein